MTVVKHATRATSVHDIRDLSRGWDSSASRLPCRSEPTLANVLRNIDAMADYLNYSDFISLGSVSRAVARATENHLFWRRELQPFLEHRSLRIAPPELTYKRVALAHRIVRDPSRPYGNAAHWRALSTLGQYGRFNPDRAPPLLWNPAVLDSVPRIDANIPVRANPPVFPPWAERLMSGRCFAIGSILATGFLCCFLLGAGPLACTIAAACFVAACVVATLDFG